MKGFQSTGPSEGKQSRAGTVLHPLRDLLNEPMTPPLCQCYEPLTVRAMQIGNPQKIGYDMVIGT